MGSVKLIIWLIRFKWEFLNYIIKGEQCSRLQQALADDRPGIAQKVLRILKWNAYYLYRLKKYVTEM